MQVENWLNEIKVLIPAHYVDITSSKYQSPILKLLPDGLNGDVILLRRAEKLNGGFRTILLVSAESLTKAGDALYWAANIRDMLPEPYSSDIYLFLTVEGASLEECNRIEADELYCRKYVRRPDELSEDFVSRTFLALPATKNSIGKMSDPIAISLSKTALVHGWLSEDNQELWKKALLSNGSPHDLAEEIMKITLED
ncbi:ABC-three component system middle component 1 [Vibrio alginolyticus]|uniref:ABC-three component system middle component 1 n=1 Tax=Vibrio TaxID=662 RepID=UPI001EEA4E9C|nr:MULTISPECIES: ABC-three component system middle component 1 [Vibrio]ELA7883015.1 hypothetical protein [Vibrio parahaemolyticus]MCG6278462.1 hypothetical protein [Vibrio vulnificus]MCR9961512.1 hypothetical protein [Vibrio alginolyticus]